jgi:hypothetical protein
MVVQERLWRLADRLERQHVPRTIASLVSAPVAPAPDSLGRSTDCAMRGRS